jgi:hypothetical protein
MRRIIIMLLAIFIIILPVKAQQVSGQTSAQAEQHADGLYYLLLGGDTTEINRICSYGDCGRGFNTRIDTLNYWGTLLSARYGIAIVPIPPAPSVSERPKITCIGDAACMASVWNRYKGT